MRRLLFILFMVWPALAMAADLHVLQDTDNDGYANACSNPAHDDYYSADTVACGGTYDIDGDSTLETIYCHPQACAWNMGTSDSCEIHAGTYGAGTILDEDGTTNLGSVDTCDKNDCWIVTVFFPGRSGGYGTSGNPGYFRGAVMNGSTDTWDPNGDKNPADSSYSVIFDGDLDDDGTYDTTTCSSNSCSGDATHAIIVGCPGNYDEYCRADMGEGRTSFKVDTDSNGTFETEVSAVGGDTDYLIIKDIEFTGYNGGNNSTSGTRAVGGIFGLGGTWTESGGSNGLVVDGVYVHDNDYSLQPSSETFWAVFHDDSNAECEDWTEFKNSYIVQNNEKVWNNDCGIDVACGCPFNVHDNRVVRDITSARASGRSATTGWAYLKSIDTGGTEAHRFWNNEFIIDDSYASSHGYFADLQAFGNSHGNSGGELWVYGNLFRDLSTTTNHQRRHWGYSCGGGTGGWDVYFFNNTFDMDWGADDEGISIVCSTSGTLIHEKNNAYWNGSTTMNPNDTDCTTERHVNEYCSFDCSGGSPGCTENHCTQPANTARTDWWDYVADPGIHDALDDYAVKDSGPLDEISANTPCDPDGDGVAGVDYDWDGVNDTSWTDIAGNTVSCPTSATAIDIGAIQSDSDSPPAPATEDSTRRAIVVARAFLVRPLW